jgi:hypothetical protein
MAFEVSPMMYAHLYADNEGEIAQQAYSEEGS